MYRKAKKQWEYKCGLIQYFAATQDQDAIYIYTHIDEDGDVHTRQSESLATLQSNAVTLLDMLYSDEAYNIRPSIPKELYWMYHQDHSQLWKALRKTFSLPKLDRYTNALTSKGVMP
jgi:hypothetical protein